MFSAHQEGRLAWLACKHLDENPYGHDVSWMALEWSQGWYEASEDYSQPDNTEDE